MHCIIRAVSGIRERHRALSRQAIVDATAALVNERRHLDFSMKEVAERAEVSLRTVYNHFPDRADLLDALGRAYDEQASALGGPHATDLGNGIDLTSAIRAANRTAEALGGLSEAFAQLPMTDIGRDEERVERTKLLVGHHRVAHADDAAGGGRADRHRVAPPAQPPQLVLAHP